MAIRLARNSSTDPKAERLPATSLPMRHRSQSRSGQTHGWTQTVAVVGLLLALVAVNVHKAPQAGANTLVGPINFSEPTWLGGLGGDQPGGPLTDVDCPVESKCIAVTGTDRVLLTTDLINWTPVEVATPNNESLDAVDCPSASLCVLVGGRGAFATVGDPWSTSASWIASDVPGAPDLIDVSCTSTLLCGAVDVWGNFVYTTNPDSGVTSWTSIEVSLEKFTSVACPSETLCVASDDHDRLWTSTQPTVAGSWQNDGDYVVVEDISCPTTAFCMGVRDGTPNISYSTNPSGGSSTWSETLGPVIGGLNSISCRTTTFCAATSSYGGIWTTTNPTGGHESWTESLSSSSFGHANSISCPTTQFCLAVDRNGRTAVRTSFPSGTWFIRTVFTYDRFTDISCPTSDLCVATDRQGEMLTSQNPSGGRGEWSPVDIDNQYRDDLAVDCPSESLCVATGGGNYFVSTNPAGGAAFWGKGNLQNSFRYSDVSCPTASFCVAVGNFGSVSLTTNPLGGSASWSNFQLPSIVDFEGVSCVHQYFCVAVGDSGQIVHSTTPKGGVDNWTAVTVSAAGKIVDVECRSENLCVAVDDKGQVLTSTDPGGGASAWSVADLGLVNFHAVECPTDELCMVVGDHGRVAVSTQPTGGTSAWNQRYLPQTWDLSGVSCATAAFCIAVDTRGNLVTATSGMGNGMLRVTTSPALPSRITVDGHVADTWGLEWVELAPGSHEVCFGDVPGYATPSCESVSVLAGETTTLTGTFTERGYLHVTTSPAVPARISIDGQPADNWGVWTDIQVGSHEVCFGAVDGYDPPSCQNVTVNPGDTTNLVGNYTANPSAVGLSGVGTLRVATSPFALGSRIILDGHVADTHGLDWLEVTPGSHEVCFGDVVGYLTPPCETVSVAEGQTTFEIGSFEQSGVIKVELSPSVAGTIWIDGAPADAWGVRTELAPGSHEVCFGQVPGYQTPACDNVNVYEGSYPTTVTGNYT